jgi:hypothetical protein
MKWRWGILLVLIIFIVIPHFTQASCNNNNICEAGETNQFPPCADCDNFCPSPFFCLSSQPAHSVSEPYVCVSPQQCYYCASGYNWDGTQCVATCTPTCTTVNTYSCTGTSNQDLYACTSVGGCLQWQYVQTCGSGTTCDEKTGQCSASCTNTCPYQGYSNCSSSTVSETCGYYGGSSCLSWGSFQTCLSGSVCTGNGVCRPSCTAQGREYGVRSFIATFR